MDMHVVSHGIVASDLRFDSRDNMGFPVEGQAAPPDICIQKPIAAIPRQIHSHAMKITLEAWGSKHYKPSPSIRILRTWAKSGQIIPAPEKVGRTYMVEEEATRIPLPEYKEFEEKISSRALRILRTS